MLILTLRIGTRDWRALVDALQRATWPAQMVVRSSLYRNAYNASKAWLLIECPVSADPAELHTWLGTLVAALDGHEIEHTVWEQIERFC